MKFILNLDKIPTLALVAGSFNREKPFLQMGVGGRMRNIPLKSD